jgi:hypothetical protein
MSGAAPVIESIEKEGGEQARIGRNEHDLISAKPWNSAPVSR